MIEFSCGHSSIRAVLLCKYELIHSAHHLTYFGNTANSRTINSKQPYSILRASTGFDYLESFLAQTE